MELVSHGGGGSWMVGTLNSAILISVVACFCCIKKWMHGWAYCRSIACLFFSHCNDDDELPYVITTLISSSTVVVLFSLFFIFPLAVFLSFNSLINKVFSWLRGILFYTYWNFGSRSNVMSTELKWHSDHLNNILVGKPRPHLFQLN